MSFEGIVINGTLVLDNGEQLPDGTRVQVIIREQSAPSSSVEATNLGQRLLKFAGIAQGLPSDMAANHDHYLHGLPKKS